MKSIMLYVLLVLSYFGLISESRADAEVDLVFVGNPGNPPDVRYAIQPVGSVDYEYWMGKYEVTNRQYVDFLNSVDGTGSNALGLFDTRMASEPEGGIELDLSHPKGMRYCSAPNGC